MDGIRQEGGDGGVVHPRSHARAHFDVFGEWGQRGEHVFGKHILRLTCSVVSLRAYEYYFCLHTVQYRAGQL